MKWGEEGDLLEVILMQMVTTGLPTALAPQVVPGNPALCLDKLGNTVSGILGLHHSGEPFPGLQQRARG